MLSATSYPKAEMFMTAAEKAARAARIEAAKGCFDGGRFWSMFDEIERREVYGTCAELAARCGG